MAATLAFLTTYGLELAALGACSLLTVYAWLRISRPRARIGDRARAESSKVSGGNVSTVDEADETDLRQQMTQMLLSWGDRLPLFNHKQRQHIAAMLLSAGIRHPQALQLFISGKLLGAGLGVTLAAVALHFGLPTLDGLERILVLGCALQAGLMAPELILRTAVKRRQKQIHHHLPDAMDLLVICTNAGCSLQASIRRVADELRELAPALANELDITAHDAQLSADPATALRKLAERCRVDSLRSLVTTLVQSQQCGTPITHSLKTLAKTERTTRMLLLEEKGAKLATKMTLPMMLLILPAVILVSAAPALLQLAEALK